MKESVCDQRGHLQIGQVPGYPNYRVLSSGSVWFRRGGHWKRLKTHPDRNGYRQIHLYSGGVGKGFFVHCAVLLAFVGPRPERNHCRHLDGNKLNNRLDNLCWGTAKENAADSIRHGTMPSKLTERDVLIIRRRVHFGKYGIQRQLTKEYGVSDTTISLIVSRHKWDRIPEEIY